MAPFGCALREVNLDRAQRKGLKARIIAAACFVIKERQGVPDDVEWHAPPEPELMSMVREFLAGLSAIQRKRLKRIAESLVLEKTRLH